MGPKLLFSPLSLYYGTFGGPFNLAQWQSGPKIAVFHNQHVQWYIWWPTDKVVPKIALFTNQPVLWYIWWPIDKVVPNSALFTSLTVLWYILWPTDKVVPKIALFQSLTVLWYLWYYGTSVSSVVNTASYGVVFGDLSQLVSWS